MVIKSVIDSRFKKNMLVKVMQDSKKIGQDEKCIQ